MTIQELGSLGELGGSVLILVTLIYISIQTKHARKSQLSLEQQAIHSGHREFFLAVMTSPELPGVIDKANSGVALSGAEKVRLVSMCQARLNLILMQFQLRKVGIGEEIDLDEEAAEVRDLFTNFGGFMGAHWPSISHAYARDFSQFIEDTLAQAR
jgi:hypothetical protein